MKAKLLWLVIVMWILALLLFFAHLSLAESVVFQWNYNTEVDGFRLYQGMTQGSDEGWTTIYDPVPIADIPSEKRTVTKNIAGKPGVVQKYCFVIRAYIGDNISPDSNEACIKIDNTVIEVPAVENLRINFEVTTIEK